jgi:hypothetical protein
MRLVLAAFVLAATIAPAAATGGIGCAAEDANIRFDAEAAVSRGMGGVFLNFRSAAELMMPGVPDDLRRLTLDDALTHSWLDGDEVKLQFYVERQEAAFASVDLAVETGQVEEGEYRGTYALVVYASPAEDGPEADRIEASGPVVCYVE